MKYKVRITKQPRYQQGGTKTLGDFSNMTEDQLENGPVYGFRPEPVSSVNTPVVNTMEYINMPSIPVATPIKIQGQSIPISNLPQKPQYTGVSIVNFLNHLGLPSSKRFRANLAKNIGIHNYTGTSSQNLKLIDYLNDPDNVIINLGGKAPVEVKKVTNISPKKQVWTWKPLPHHGTTINVHDLIPDPGIQQREGLSTKQMAIIMAAGLAGSVLPRLMPFTRYYPVGRGLPPPRVPQIPGPRNLPGKPFTRWTTSSGHISPFQNGGEQDAQEQIIQIVQAYAQASGVDPKTILLQLQKMQPEQQQQALQQMYAAVSGDQQDMGYEDQGEEMQSAAYGGQMGYGLDLGARRLWMNQNGDESSQVNDSIEEVPREDANIEAEGGETAMIPNKEQGSYMHKKIKGKRHTEGGVPLNVPEGTFIFSDTKKMKLGGSVLKLFGKSDKSSKKYTPADLAKQYNIDKYISILNDTKSDPVAKRTAELMIQNYEKKLAQLALVQEGKKGFPQGVPQVAQSYYQQMMQAQQGEEQEMQQEVPQQAQAMYGMGFKYGGGLKQFEGHEDGSEVDITNIPPQRFTYTNPPTFDDNKLSPPKSSDDYYTVQTVDDDNKPIVTNETLYPDDNINEERKKSEFKRYVKEDEEKSDEDEKKLDEDEKNLKFKTYYGDNIKYGWTNPDKLNMLNSLINLASVKKSTPFEPAVQLQRPQTFYTDPSRALAANAEQMNAARQAAGMFAGPQSRYSFNAGQYGKNAADIIGQYAMQNVGIGNQAAQQNAAITNQQIQYDAQRAKRLYDADVIGEQQYQNGMRQARAAALQAYTQAHENAANLYNLSSTQSPYYAYNPSRGTTYFRSEQARKDFYNSNKQDNSNNDYASAWDKAQKLADERKLTGKQRDEFIKNYANSLMKK